MATSFYFARQLFLNRRAHIYRKIAHGLRRNQSPSREIRAMYKNATRRKSPLATVYKRWDEDIRGKASGRFALALKSTVPPTDFALIATAEEVQELPAGLEFLSTTVMRIEEMRSSFIDAIRSIIMPTVMLILMIIGTDKFFFPNLSDSLPKKDWPYVTQLVSSIAHDTGTILSSLVVVLPLLLFLWWYSLSRWTGRGRNLAEKVPLLYTKYRNFQCVVFLMQLAFLRGPGGKGPQEALSRMQKYSSPYLAYHINLIRSRINKDATNIGDALVSTGLFNLELADLISDYTRFPDWHTKLEEIAQVSLDIVTKEVKRLGTTLQEVLQLSIGVIVLTVVFAGSFALVKMMMSISMR